MTRQSAWRRGAEDSALPTLCVGVVDVQRCRHVSTRRGVRMEAEDAEREGQQQAIEQQQAGSAPRCS